MTDNTIPADKVQKIIDSMNADLKATAPNKKWGDGYDSAVSNYKEHLEALLPKPPTLADELRGFDGKETRHGRLMETLNDIADRVETLEQERDEALAEIARLEGLEVPGGWRVANHDHFGPVIAADTLDDGRHHCVFRSNVGPGISQTWVEPALLSFCDEAPAPQQETEEAFLEKVEQALTDRYGPAPTPQPEHIDPASCGRYRPYLVSCGIDHSPAFRCGEDAFAWFVVDAEDFYPDCDITVLRRLTPEEMDAR